MVSLLLVGFCTIAKAQEAELQAAIDAIKSQAPNVAQLAKTAYKKNKKDAAALLKVARAFYEQKDAASAILFANYANEAGMPKYQYAPAYLLLGDVEASYGIGGEESARKAAGYYNKAITFDPANPEGYKKWAKVYYKIDSRQAFKKLQEMKAFCPDEDVDAIAAQIFSQPNDVKNVETNTKPNTNKIDEIIELIKKDYKDPCLSKLYTNPDGEKIYKFEDEENIAFQGRACWKTEMQYLMFGDDNSMGIITAVTFDLITPYGGHGKRVYKAGPKGEECRYILVNGIIYKWEKEDYSDLHEYLLFDSENNILQSIDKQKKFKLVNKEFK